MGRSICPQVGSIPDWDSFTNQTCQVIILSPGSAGASKCQQMPGLHVRVRAVGTLADVLVPPYILSLTDSSSGEHWAASGLPPDPQSSFHTRT